MSRSVERSEPRASLERSVNLLLSRPSLTYHSSHILLCLHFGQIHVSHLNFLHHRWQDQLQGPLHITYIIIIIIAFVNLLLSFHPCDPTKSLAKNSPFFASVTRQGFQFYFHLQISTQDCTDMISKQVPPYLVDLRTKMIQSLANQATLFSYFTINVSSPKW